MNRRHIGRTLLALGVLSTACKRGPASGKLDDKVLAERGAAFQTALARADTGADRSKPLARWVLPARLGEISGLALTTDGRLLAHGDEHATVFEIDYRRGMIVKQFTLGKPAIRGDFEGITVADSAVIIMIDSKGKLYQFREGAEGEQVEYVIHDTNLGSECEFEGVAFDSADGSVLLACKNIQKKSLEGNLLIYRWKLQGQGGAGEQPSEIKVPLEQVIGTNKWKDLRPSDMTIDPLTGNYVFVASQEKALIQITPTGQVIFARPLSGKHPQAEGIAITKDSILIVSDETAGSQPAAITLYRWP